MLSGAGPSGDAGHDIFMVGHVLLPRSTGELWPCQVYSAELSPDVDELSGYSGPGLLEDTGHDVVIVPST